MRIIPYLILLIFVSFMILPVSADEYTHEIYQSTGSPDYHNGGAGTTSTTQAYNRIWVFNVDHAPSVHYLIIESVGKMNGNEGSPNPISFTNGLTGTTYLTHFRNLLGQITGSRMVIFFDNWEDYAPQSGTYQLVISQYASTNTFMTGITRGGVTPAIPSNKAVAVIGGGMGLGFDYGEKALVKLLAYYQGEHTITLNYTADTELLLGTISSAEINDNTRYVYLSTTPEEQSSSIFYREAPAHGNTWNIITPSPVATYYLTSEMGGDKKQWMINLDLGGGEEKIPEEYQFTLHKINQPPHQIGNEISYQLYSPVALADAIDRIEFTTTKGGYHHSSRIYIREGEIFKVNGLGEYTLDEILYYFTPDTVEPYYTGVIVYADDSVVFTTSVSDEVTTSQTTSIMRAEIISGYDDSFVYNSNAVFEWGGVERFNDTLSMGVYQTNVPKNTIVTATITHPDYDERIVSHTMADDYNRWLIVLTPTEIIYEPTECLVQFGASDGINPLPNTRILFDGNVKYTNQLGGASWITSDIGLKTYSATKTGYESITGSITTIANDTVYKSIILTPLSVTPPPTEQPTITPTPIPHYPSVGDEGWGVISAIKWMIATFLGIEDELWVNSILALCIIITASLAIAQYTRDAGGALIGAVAGFFIALVIGLIPLWIVFVMLALGGFVGFIMLNRGG